MDEPKKLWMQVQVNYLQNIPKIVLMLTLIILPSTIVTLYHPIISTPLSRFFNFSPFFSGDPTRCDLSAGEWIPDPEAPYYTNTTCWAIHEHQNCVKYGRPDTEFMKWRWKPNGCELPLFNASQFLELFRGKSFAFIGDSIARNHMQSLICLISKVTYPEAVSYTDEYFKRWVYKDYNVTLAAFWSPFLVKSTEPNLDGPTHTGLFNLYLDEFDEKWTTHIEEFDYMIISAGNWFFKPAVFYQDNKISGCFYCNLPNIAELTLYHGYKMAFRTAFKAINSLSKLKGTTILRTFSPSHFENGLWNEGGNCKRTRPYKNNEIVLSDSAMKIYSIQLEEFRRAKQVGEKKGLDFRLLDTTQAMLLRPDGHPSRYGHTPDANVTLYNDCVHWCLPGPIDAWNDFLVEIMRRDGAGK